MTEPLTPKQISELASGYVLGDLTSEEAAIFQKLLINDPTLNAEVHRLQETLGFMIYGLPATLPPSTLKSSILATAAANFDGSPDMLLHNQGETSRHPPSSSATRLPEADSRLDPSKRAAKMLPFGGPRWPASSPRFRLLRLSQPWITASAVALLAIALGWENNRLRQQIQTLQAQLAQQTIEIARQQQPNDAVPITDVITITPAQTFLASNWQGIEQLAQDHAHSIIQPQGPVEIASSQPEEIVERLPQHFSKPSSLALLNQENSTLLGGSLCQFGQTKGLRLTYQVNQTKTISLYQLERIEHDSFPQPGETRLYMNQSSGPGIVFWGDESFLYAMVAELPAEKLKRLAEQVVLRG